MLESPSTRKNASFFERSKPATDEVKFASRLPTNKEEGITVFFKIASGAEELVKSPSHGGMMTVEATGKRDHHKSSVPSEKFHSHCYRVFSKVVK
ncbi:hypothetical protein SUGI_0379870 [Cryptomeria japonica]|nr:hypothetical protein SUGI_0379870 [Cryptomeria japonica]